MAKTGNGDNMSHLLAGCLAVTDLLRSLAVFFGHGLWHSTCRAHASPVVSSQSPTTGGNTNRRLKQAEVSKLQTCSCTSKASRPEHRRTPPKQQHQEATSRRKPNPPLQPKTLLA